MKILFITHYDNMYGANMALYKLIKGLKTEYNQEPILLIPAKGKMTDELERLGVKCIVNPVTQWQAVYSTAFRFAVKRYMRKRQINHELEYLLELLKDEGIDVIHSNSSVIGIGAMLSKRLGCKHVWHIREFSKEHFGMKYFYSDKAVKSYYEAADTLITISDSLKENYVSKYPDANIIRIYDGVTGDESWRHAEDDKIIRFCYVGYLFRMKHQLDLIEAAKLLSLDGLNGFEIYIVGDGDAEYKSKLINKIEEYGLSDVVKMTGYVSDIQDLYSKMHVGVIASEYEGFGLVTVEYMLHGMPVIGRRSGGTAEIIEDKRTGILYENITELAMAMKQMIENGKERKMLGQAGIERAKEFFSEEKNTSRIIDLYRNMIKDNTDDCN